MRWYFSRNGETVGPVEEGQVVEWVKAGAWDAMVRDEAGGPWTAIGQSPFYRFMVPHAQPALDVQASRQATPETSKLGELLSGPIPSAAEAAATPSTDANRTPRRDLLILSVVVAGIATVIVLLSLGVLSAPAKPEPKHEPVVSAPAPPQGSVLCKGGGLSVECKVGNPTTDEARICWRVEARCSNTEMASAAKCQEVSAGKDETVQVNADDFGPQCDSIVTAKSADVSTAPVYRATAGITSPNRDQPRSATRCVLRAREHSKAVIFPTKAGSDEFRDAEGRGLDTGALAVIAQANRMFIVEDGTPCNFIDYSFLSASKVRVLAGINAGRVGYTTDVSP